MKNYLVCHCVFLGNQIIWSHHSETETDGPGFPGLRGMPSAGMKGSRQITQGQEFAKSMKKQGEGNTP